MSSACHRMHRPIVGHGHSIGMFLAAALSLGAVCLAIPAATHAAGQAAVIPHEEILPPAIPWSGTSETLQAEIGDEWITPGEETGLLDSPNYDETVAWIKQLVDAAPELRMISIGSSHERRDIWMVVATREGGVSPEDLRKNGRPTLLVHAGIHSGEIDGKDAGMMLLRDMTVGGSASDLLDECNLLFIPILSVDAHENRSPYSRINQRGPEIQGWRTNARNQNLNRDFAKADTPEIQALLGVINSWAVDLYLDVHVTDGADYQYDITYGFNGAHAWSPSIGSWLSKTLRPSLDADLSAMGHVPGDLIFAVNGMDMYGGVWAWTAGPRFSNGYGDARHLPTVLIENHSLKDFRRRVLGTRVFLESAMRLLGREQESLRTATAADKALRRAEIAAGWQVPEGEKPMVEFLGVKSERLFSEVMGDTIVRWLGEAEVITIPVFAATEATAMLSRPAAYWVPAAWSDVIARLAMHGIELELLDRPRELTLEFDRLDEIVIEAESYESHVRMSATSVPFTRKVTMAKGSARVSTDQTLGDLAVLLLEPGSPDSFFQWGFFVECAQRAEYFEAYAIEPMARRMMEEDPSLAAEFEAKLIEDEEFASDPRARLEWFYQRTPYYDQRYEVYPVGRER